MYTEETTTQEKKFGRLTITPSTPAMSTVCSRWEGDYERYYMNEIMYIVDGECVLTINGYTYIATSQNLVLVPKHASFSHRLTSKKKLTYFSVKLDAELFGQSLFEYLELTADNHVIAVPDGNKVYSIIESCVSNCTDFYAYRLNLCSQLSQILSIYVEERLSERKKMPEDIDDHFEPVIDYMKKNLDKNIAINELSKIVHMPASTFNRKFLHTFGISPIRYYDNLRIQKVVELITHSDWPISKISHAIGIDNKYYFAKFFMKHMNVSPYEYMDIFRHDLNG